MKTYWAASIAIIGSFLLSYVTCAIAGALLCITREFCLSPFKEGVVASAILLGALVGATCCGSLADRIGRRSSLQISAFLFFATSLLVFFAHSFFALILFRFATGVAVGMASILVPLYLAETAPPTQRGALVASSHLAMALGTLAAYLVNYAFADAEDWRSMFSLAALPAALQTLALFFVPESPKWLSHRKEKNPSQWKGLLLPPFRFVLFLGIALSAFQQLSGINALIYFAPKIFQEAGFKSSKEALFITLILGIVNVFTTLLSLFLIDRLGRRKLLLWSEGCMIACLVAVVVAFATESHLLDQVAVFAVIGCVGAYAAGMGPVTWVLISEIYPFTVRAKAIAALIFLNWLMNYLVVLTFPYLVSEAGTVVAFLSYTLCSAIAFLLFLRYVPETKGKRLEELETLLIGKH